MNNTPQTPPNNEPEPELENITTNILKPDDWAIPFLEAYTGHNKNAKAYGIISKAAKPAGVTRQAVEKRIKTDLIFKTLLEQAQEEIKDTVRHEVIRRALEPNKRPIYQRGEMVGEIQEYDNQHLRWVAERMMREEFHLPTIIELTAEGTTGAFTFHMGENNDPPLELEATEEPENET